MYNIAAAVADIGTMFTNTGTIITAVVATVLVGLIALLGLGFGVRKLRGYITGRKF